MEILYDARADFDVENNCGETPLQYAAQKGNKKRSTETDPIWYEICDNGALP